MSGASIGRRVRGATRPSRAGFADVWEPS